MTVRSAEWTNSPEAFAFSFFRTFLVLTGKLFNSSVRVPLRVALESDESGERRKGGERLVRSMCMEGEGGTKEIGPCSDLSKGRVSGMASIRQLACMTIILIDA